MNIDQYEKLTLSFYIDGDVDEIAEKLLGKYLFTNIDGEVVGGRIVETEAYNGRNDKACHAYKKRTPRTEIMYGSGGKAYIYLCYGIHHLFNVVTNKEGLADAVLIRALEPIEGLETMRKRRNMDQDHRLTSGPGLLSQAFGLKITMTGVDLTGDQIWISERKDFDEEIQIETDVRIGVDYAEEDALLPWRFYVVGSNFVSKKKTPT